MDEVDKLILHSLQRLDCDLENVQTLKSLTASHVVEAIIRCLWAINPVENRTKFPSFKIPAAMGARFKLGNDLSEAVQAVGFKGTIGYQSILYGSDIEIRRILIFLIEKLPKDVDVKISTDLSPMEALKKRSAAKIQAQIQAPWIPWFCKKYNGSV